MNNFLKDNIGGLIITFEYFLQLSKRLEKNT